MNKASQAKFGAPIRQHERTISEGLDQLLAAGRTGNTLEAEKRDFLASGDISTSAFKEAVS